jgi:pimeloyl-ACP methyl ester carboxylesterase
MFSLLLVCSLVFGADPLPAGQGKFEVELGGKPIEVFTYKPASFKGGPMLVVFHGTLRNAEEYRDNARSMGDRFGMLIVTPKFDRQRFPDAKYNRGGLVDSAGHLNPKDQWTWSYIPALVAEIRRREGSPEMPCYFIGHSAGAQFAERLAAFVPTDARNIIVANAGVHLFPTRDMPFSFGFGGLPEEVSGDEQLRSFLRQPLTIYLGTADTNRDNDLFVGEQGDQQGRNRLERGRNFFKMGEELARSKGWEFHWRLVEAPGVSHDGQKMFNHVNCEKALFIEKND